VQVAGELERRGADVDHHGLAVLDHRGRRRADPVLGLEALDLDLGERLLAGDADGAAADALELAVAGQRLQVPAHGHLGHAEARGQVRHVGLTAADGAEDLLAALGGKQAGHGCSVL
jgi:hypothetical protein